MAKAEITSYSVVDLLSWQESGGLELSPKFQRRNVWSNAARSYFIDSVAREYPIPPIHIRMTVGPSGRPVREVIDGQQRIRALFDFIQGKFRIPESISTEIGGKLYGTLLEEFRTNLNEFSFTVYQYKSLTDSEVLDIFARLNTYSVQLSAQELRNGKWFGAFKQASYQLAASSLEFWRSHKILTELQIARMKEAELTSELLIAALDGMQDGKKSLDVFYENLDDKWGTSAITWPATTRLVPDRYVSAKEAGSEFQNTLAAIDDVVGDTLRSSPLRRQALFYTLYCAFYHLLYGLPRGENLPLNSAGMDLDIESSLREVVGQLTELFESKGRTRNEELARFYQASARQTDNIGPRYERLETLLALIQQSS